MDYLYEKVLRPIFFKTLDPEKAHEAAVLAMKYLSSAGPLCKLMEKFNFCQYEEPVNLFGISFPNRVGLAAGFDKNAVGFKCAKALGFGHIEVGTITNKRQAGNEKPRVFRYPAQESVVNSFGFPNHGAEIIAKRLTKSLKGKKSPVPLGINIGKSKIVGLEEAANDYQTCYNLLADFADFFVINISSPNTPDLRKLQTKHYLSNLLGSIVETNKQRAKKMGTNEIPILVKIAPDLTFNEIDEILEATLDIGLNGIVATNTTIERPYDFLEKKGGLSGKLITEKSRKIVSYIKKSTQDKLPIIGVGGIMTPEDAGAMIDAGADLIQLYTSLIYRGPFFAKEIAKSVRTSQSSF